MSRLWVLAARLERSACAEPLRAGRSARARARLRFQHALARGPARRRRCRMPPSQPQARMICSPCTRCCIRALRARPSQTARRSQLPVAMWMHATRSARGDARRGSRPREYIVSPRADFVVSGCRSRPRRAACGTGRQHMQAWRSDQAGESAPLNRCRPQAAASSEWDGTDAWRDCCASVSAGALALRTASDRRVGEARVRVDRGAVESHCGGGTRCARGA
eukprot:6186445-Pleurochrysis_carterae.AAC.2